MFRSSNPTLSPKIFDQAREYGAGESMTIQGTVNKCFIMLFLIFVTAAWVWGKVMQPVGPFSDEQTIIQSAGKVLMYGQIGALVAFVLVIVTSFNLKLATFTAPLYALCEGLALGGFSAYMEYRYPGIAMQAVALTFGVLFALLSAYKSGMIKVTDKFVAIATSALMGIVLIYVVGWIMSFFGARIPLIHESGPVGIGFSLFVCALAASFLVIDFDRIAQYSERGLPKYMEWYSALSLMITLIWLYLEILILLAKLRGGDRR